MSRYSSPLLSKQVKDILVESRFAQHLISVIFLYTLIQANSNSTDSFKNFNYTVIVYTTFILSNKLDLQFFSVYLCGLLIYITYEKIQNNKEKNIEDDKNLSSETKNHLINDIETKKKIVISSIYAILLVGVILYCDRKKDQYGGGFNYNTFFFQ
jgi:hypothetical protein